MPLLLSAVVSGSSAVGASSVPRVFIRFVYTFDVHATVNLRKERECPVYMLKSVILAGEKRGEDDEEFEVQLYSRSHYPGWRNNVQNATIEIEFEPDMYKMIEHPLGTAH